MKFTSKFICVLSLSLLWVQPYTQSHIDSSIPNATTTRKGGCQMDKRRLPNGMVWVTKVTFLFEVQKQVKAAPKSFTRTPRTLPVTLPSPPKIKSYKWVTLSTYERHKITVKSLEVQKQGAVKQGPPVEKKPKKQVRWNIDDKLGSEPTLPLCMTLLLAKGETVKQPNPISTITGPTDSLKPIPREGPNGVLSPLEEPGLMSQPSHPLPGPNQSQRNLSIISINLLHHKQRP